MLIFDVFPLVGQGFSKIDTNIYYYFYSEVKKWRIPMKFCMNFGDTNFIGVVNADKYNHL